MINGFMKIMKTNLISRNSWVFWFSWKGCEVIMSFFFFYQTVYFSFDEFIICYVKTTAYWYSIFTLPVTLKIRTYKVIEVFSYEVIVKTWPSLVIYKKMLHSENALKCHNNYFTKCDVCPTNVVHC